MISALIAPKMPSGDLIMKKLRKNTQLSLTNPKGAGRPAIHDVGIRHISRPAIKGVSALHLTIKVRENKAEIKSRKVLKALHHAIKRARLRGLKVIHYSLEYNHVHLLVECGSHVCLRKGMQALGISLAKAINRIKCTKGVVYKHRYHFRKLNSRRELKNAMIYIFKNGMKHGRSRSVIDPYNSLVAEKRIPADMQKTIQKSEYLKKLRDELQGFLERESLFFISHEFLWG